MNHRLYAMDTWFATDPQAYPFERRCEITAELGFDGTCLTLWDEAAWEHLDELHRVRSRHGLDIASVYLPLTLTDRGFAEEVRARWLIERLASCRRLELAIKGGDRWLPDDPSGRVVARAALERLLPLADANDLRLTLYPHRGHWLQSHAFAADLCRQLAHPRLRLAFSGYHWYAGGGRPITGCLDALRGTLSHANLCGCGSGTPARPRPTILPLDEGELDNGAVLASLRQAGLGGDAWIGLQGYGIGGDIVDHLRRSRDVLQGMLDRVDGRRVSSVEKSPK